MLKMAFRLGVLMFEVDLLKKKGLQSISDLENKVIKHSDANISDTIENDSLDPNYYYLLLIIIFSLFVYVYYYNQSKYNESYHNIYPGKILSLINMNNIDSNIYSIESSNNHFIINKKMPNDSDVYHEQAFFDSLFKIQTFISIDKNESSLYIPFNWYVEYNDDWNIVRLYDKLIEQDSMVSKIDFYNNKIISVADYNELIVIFNVLRRLNIEHVFKYEIELFKQTIYSEKDYYKMIISDYD